MTSKNHDHEYLREPENSGNSQSWLYSRTGVATLVAVSVLGFLVYTGHSAHLLGALPYLLLLACPLMHVFMHGGHGGHGGHHHDDDENAARKSETPPSPDAQKKDHHKGGCH